MIYVESKSISLMIPPTLKVFKLFSLQECLWPLLHKHLKEAEEHGTFSAVIISDLEADQLRPGLRSGTQELRERRNYTLSTIKEKVQMRLLVTVDFLYAGCTMH